MGGTDSSASQGNTTGEHTVTPADPDADTDTSMDALADSPPHGMSISQAAPRLQNLPRTIGETLLTTAADADTRTRKAAQRAAEAFNRIGDDLTAITEDDTRPTSFDRFAGDGLPFCKPAMRQSLTLLPLLAETDPQALLNALAQAYLNRTITLADGTIIELIDDLGPESDIMSILRAMQAGMRPTGDTGQQTSMLTAAILLYGYWSPTINAHTADPDIMQTMQPWDTTIINREHILHPIHWDEDLLRHPDPTRKTMTRMLDMIRNQPYYMRLLQGMASYIGETIRKGIQTTTLGSILYCAIQYARISDKPTADNKNPSDILHTSIRNPQPVTGSPIVREAKPGKDTPKDENPKEKPRMLITEYPGQAAAISTIIRIMRSMDTETLDTITLHEAHTEDTIRLLKDSITYGPAYAREAYKTTVRQHR